MNSRTASAEATWATRVWVHNTDYGVHWTSARSWERITDEGILLPSDNNLLWFEAADSLGSLKNILREGGRLTGARRTDVAIITDLANLGPPRIVGGGGRAYLLPEGMELSGPDGRGLTWWWNSGSNAEIKKIANMIREGRRTF